MFVFSWFEVFEFSGKGFFIFDQRVARDLDAEQSILQGRYALAHARKLYGEYTIGIFGIDLIVGTEYFVQKACVEKYIGEACGRGIQILLPPETALCKQEYRYGYETAPRAALIEMVEMTARRDALNQRKGRLIAELQTLDGAIQERELDMQITELRSRGGVVPMPLTAG